MTAAPPPPTSAARLDDLELQEREQREQRGFLARHPGYEETRILDELRARELSRVDAAGHVYLDYTGSGLYTASQVRRHAEALTREVLGNPHSQNPTSLRCTELVERCRGRILEYFRADPGEHQVIFTPNASGALKLIGESYPFEPGGELLLTFDNHNSVNGIREFARARGARTTYVTMQKPELRVDEEALARALAAGSGRQKLFAYPAQSNFTGVQHPLAWIDRAKVQGWDVALDAASFAPTNRLDLSEAHPDFVALSFYKMFGYPTGIGALIARREALARLRRPWFGGGTVSEASVQADRHVLSPGAAGFEDGSVDFLNIPAVELGIELMESVGVERIHRRVTLLVGWLIEELLELRHGNGRPLVHIYGPTTTERRGGVVSMNLHDAEGRVIDRALIERRAAEQRISLRTGALCNPGAVELALGLSPEELTRGVTEAGGRVAAEGAVRISLGMGSNFADVFAFREFARQLLAGVGA